MKVLLKVILLSLTIISATSLMTEEEYAEYQNTTEHQTLDYETYKMITKQYLSGPKDYTRESFYNDVDNLKQSYTAKAEAEDPELRRTIEASYLSTTNAPIPRDFDWRRQAPHCFSQSSIKQQGQCGSCFAFSASFALSSRFCINDRRYAGLFLSPQDILECDYSHGKCQGGDLPPTWLYLERTGACNDQCKTYYSGRTQNVGRCRRYCDNFRTVYSRYQAIPNTLAMPRTPDQIKQQLMTYGPMMTGIMARPDLGAYRGGIYISNEQGDIQPHAVALIGWGVDAKHGDYWIIANSWGQEWGDKGYLYVKFGVSEVCEIGALASLPRYK